MAITKKTPEKKEALKKIEAKKPATKTAGKPAPRTKK